jgi:hypothetical protein
VGTSGGFVQNGWIFKGRRGGCPFYVYLEDEDAGGIGAGLHVGPGEDQVYFIKEIGLVSALEM